MSSGNTAGARFWTDGKCLAPMLPEYLIWVKCPNCGYLLWINDQKITGVVKSPYIPDDYINPDFARLDRGDALHCINPLPEEYFAKAEKLTNEDLEKSKYIRLHVMWIGNDERRNIPDPLPLSERERKNLEAYSAILDESNEEERITKAEVLRELGRFDEAEILLSKPFDDVPEWVIKQLLELIKLKDPRVKELIIPK
jgi:hypothetical protein